ncbi:MAG: 50S ribosomal protein L31 [Candidatus Levybacteria bacterium]|nr:50S ribosomal protein L31 [Candidatus Levybacteria bacterium]
MKQGVHPQYFENAQVICNCGNRFTTGSTREVIHVELCSNCHPFYTGEQKFVDSASRIQKFQNRTEAAKKYQVVKKQKKEKEAGLSEAPKTLREMLSQVS